MKNLVLVSTALLCLVLAACGGGGGGSAAIPAPGAVASGSPGSAAPSPSPGAPAPVIPGEDPLPTMAPPNANPTKNPLPAVQPNFQTVEAPVPWNYTSVGPDRHACASNEGLVYHVGPTEAYKDPHEVPWLRLLPCDQVFIDYRQQPYVDRIYITVRGAQGKAIRIAGVPGPNGQLPVFDGHSAIEYTDEDYNQYEEPFGMITVGFPGTTPKAYGYEPGYLQIENLEIRNVNADDSSAGYYVNANGVLGATFYNWDGRVVAGIPPGHAFGTGLYIFPAQHVTIRNLYIHDNSMGAFVNSQDGSHAQSRDFLFIDNHLANNGSLHHATVHNFYFELIGERVIHNRFDAPLPMLQGENIKDRSVCVEYSDNYVEGGNHVIAFRDPQSNGAYEVAELDAFGEPCLKNLFIHGNTIVGTGPQLFNEMSEMFGFGDGEGNGPANDANNRYGDVYFYDNVVVARGDYDNCGCSFMKAMPIFTNPNITKPSTFHAINDLFYAMPATATGLPMSFARCYYQGSVYFENSWMNAGNTSSRVPATPLIATFVNAPSGVEAAGSPCDLQNLGEPSSSLTPLVLSTANPGFVNAAGGDYHTTSASPFAQLITNTNFPAAITTRGLLPDGKPYPN
ncbi:MAG: hypothetical protein KGN02_13875 [bacterium]|nr:hypothetical protein [bacterium]